MRVIGIRESAGEYQGTPYHNVVLHTVVAASVKGSVGELCEIVKIKYESINDVFGKPMTADDWNELIGKNIQCSYDKYGRCVGIFVVEK